MFWFVVLIVAVVYLLLLGMLWQHQERIVFQPPPATPNAVARLASTDRVRQVSYRAEDGVELFGFVVGDVVRAERFLIAFHGNADLARFLVPWAQAATRVASVAVMLPELRGYDGLPGRPTYRDAACDARAAREFVERQLTVRDDRIAYFGHSLGSAIAAELAAESTPIALLLQSPFSSARAMARRMALPGLSLFWPLVSRGVGLGLIFVPLTGATMAELAPQQLAQGTGMFNLTRQLGGSLGIAISATLLSRFTAQSRALLAEHVVVGDPLTTSRLDGLTRALVAKGADLLSAKQQALTILDRQLQGQASVLAFSKLYLLSGIALVAALPLMLLFRTGKSRGLGAGSVH